MKTETVPGTIVAYDHADALGDILLDDGRLVRFALRSCGPMGPRLHERVIAGDFRPGYLGRVRADYVRSETPRPVEELLVWPEPWVDFEEGAAREAADRRYHRFEPDEFYAAHPRWSDLARGGGVLPPPPPPPLFAPVAADVGSTAQPCHVLADDGLGGGAICPTHAPLGRAWARCTRCLEPMDLVLLLQDVEAVPSGYYFAAFLCAECRSPYALGGDRWHFECGACADDVAKPERGTPAAHALVPPRCLAWAPAASYPDASALREHGGAAPLALATIVRVPPRDPYPESKTTGADVYRRWLGLDGRRSQLGGHVAWRVDGDETTPSCPACAAPLRLLCALAEEDTGLPLGDDGGGTLYFFFCACSGLQHVRVVHELE